MILASWGSLEGPLGGLFGLLEDLLGCLGAILSVLGRSFGDSVPPWAVLGFLGPSWPVLEPSWVRKRYATRRGKPQGNRGKPEKV